MTEILKIVTPQAFQYFWDAWHVASIRFEPATNDKIFANKDLMDCEHVKSVFQATRVPEHMPDFYQQVCRSSKDMCTKHPVPVLGQWRQGKSSLVNSIQHKAVQELCLEQGKPHVEKLAKVGRREATTKMVTIYEIDAGTNGKILLADTPGWEPDRAYPILEEYRQALQEKKCCADVLTDVIVLVIAGMPQSLAELRDKKSIRNILSAYQEMRSVPHISSVLIPVITFADMVTEHDRAEDARHVTRELERLFTPTRPMKGDFAQCDEGAAILCAPDIRDPIYVSNEDSKLGVDEVLNEVRKTVEKKISSKEFKLQWIGSQNDALKSQVLEFHRKWPLREVELQLFHHTVHAQALAHGQVPMNVEYALRAPRWDLLAAIERKLRGEETTGDRVLSLLSCMPQKAHVGLPITFFGVGVVALLKKPALAQRMWAAAKAP